VGSVRREELAGRGKKERGVVYPSSRKGGYLLRPPVRHWEERNGRKGESSWVNCQKTLKPYASRTKRSP